jgi:hypothetical protein
MQRFLEADLPRFNPRDEATVPYKEAAVLVRIGYGVSGQRPCPLKYRNCCGVEV